MDILILNHTNLVKKLGMIALMGLITSGASADVYKVTDAEGSVIYTDRLQNYMDNPNVTVEPMSVNSSQSNTGQTHNNTNTNITNSTTQIPSTNRSTITTNTTTTNTTTTNTHTNTQNNNIHYQLTIEEPAEEQAYRKPAQEISVSVNVSPELQNGDSVVIMVDDSQYATGLSTIIPTIDLLPGEHTLTVNIVNSDSEVQTSESMRFYIIQNTNALQQRQQLLKQLQAYQNLPWYQKLYLQLRQEELVEKPNPNADGQVTNSFTAVQSSSSSSLSGLRSQNGVRSSF